MRRRVNIINRPAKIRKTSWTVIVLLLLIGSFALASILIGFYHIEDSSGLKSLHWGVPKSSWGFGSFYSSWSNRASRPNSTKTPNYSKLGDSSLIAKRIGGGEPSKLFAAGSSSNIHQIAYFTPSAYNGSIFLYFLYHSDSFSIANYKSLESLLTIYPSAKIIVRIVGPEKADYYKVGNIISKQTFQKYIKYGFPIRIVVQYMDFNKNSRALLPGYSFWTSAFNIFYDRAHITQMRNLNHVPFFITFYDYIVTLYLNGGMVSDFSSIHLMPVKIVGQNVTAVSIRTYCLSPSYCFVSTFLAVPAGHPLLRCLLTKYEVSTDKSFLDCLKVDLVNAGVHCIRQAVAHCYKELSLVNPWDNEETWCSCKANSSASYSFNQSSIPCSGYSINYDRMLWTEALDAEGYLHMLSTSRSSLPIVWLGSRAVEENWMLPLPTSMLGYLLEQLGKKLQLRVQQHLKRVASYHLKPYNASALPQCSHYAIPEKDRLTAVSSSDHIRSTQLQAEQSCSLTFVLPGFMKAGTSFVFETLIGHPLLLRALRGTEFKETGCYLGTNPDSPVLRNAYLQRLHCFPFVQSHEPLYFGDATIYYAHSRIAAKSIAYDNPNVKVLFSLRNPLKRAQSQHRFDFLAYQNEGYGNLNDCLSLALDPSQGKLLHWKEVAAKAVEYYEKYHKLGLETNPYVKELMDLYKQGLRKGTVFAYFRCSNLIVHSLYFLSVFIWSEVIPVQNIRLLFTEFLDPRSLSSTLKKKSLDKLPIIEQRISATELWSGAFESLKDNHSALFPLRRATLDRIDRKYLLHQFNGIYRFLGLPERTKMLPGGGHETPLISTNIATLNETVRIKLQELFLPFNQLLDIFLDMQRSLLV